jgi:hypothetical protein
MTAEQRESIELMDKNLQKALACGVCGYTCLKAVLCDLCQHPFCFECSEEVESCPTKGCDSDLTDSVDITPFFDRILLRADAMCKNEGCGFTAQYPLVMEHAENCEFKKEWCHLCNRQLLLKDLDDHEQECPEVLIKCPNKCGKNNEIKMLRKDMDQHLQNTCKKRVVSCRFSKNGCDFEGEFKSYLKHLVDCDFDAPLEKKRKAEDTTESESEEESLKPLKKRKIVESEDEDDEGEEETEEQEDDDRKGDEMIVGTPVDDDMCEQITITDEKVIKVERSGFMRSFTSILRSASSAALEAFNKEENVEVSFIESANC